MHSFTNLYENLCSYENLELAFKKARKHKTTKKYVVNFESKLNENLLQLQKELTSQQYLPKPLETFTLRDPKTRVISKSDFRDRVVHHAICNIIEPLFESIFINDSYANRLNKGTLKAIQRFEYFKRKLTKNNSKKCFVLKADILHYFDTVNHKILLSILGKRIKDEKVLSLISVILANHQTKHQGAGMPLGNLTSQFFANVYLNELDYFVKHTLRVKYYIRYVDDFVILHESKATLEKYLYLINKFLQESLALAIHPEKSRILSTAQGIPFLGLRVYEWHKLLKKCNIRKFVRELQGLCAEHKNGNVKYDSVYDFIEGWIAYSKQANTFSLRKMILAPLQEQFAGELSAKEINRLEKDSKINSSFIASW